MSKRGPGKNKAQSFDGLRFHELVATPASLYRECVCDGVSAVSQVCRVRERYHRRCKCDVKDTSPSGCFVSPLGTALLHAKARNSSRAWVGLSMRVCVCVRVCVLSVSICANQAKTNVLLHSRLAFKILRLVPLVWLWEHPPPKQPRN